jgi:outer membrane protein TolC
MNLRVPALILGLSLALGAQETRPTMPLSFSKSIEIALAPDGNTKVQLAAEAIREAQARKAEARSALLPNVDASWTSQSFTNDLATFGLQITIPIPGFRIPTFVGPISTYDLRATATQTVFDLSSIRRLQSAGATVSAAKLDSQESRLQAAASAGKAYLNAARAETAVRTALANVELAERELRLAQQQKEAGTATGLDITRAQVEQQTEKQRLIAAREDRETSRLNLLRAMNLNLDLDFELTDKLKYEPVEIPDPAKAVQTAIGNRPDLKAQNERERSAKLSYDAAKFERLPSVSAFGNYGDIGLDPTILRPTRTAGVSLRLPIFDGGRRDAQRAEASSELRSEAIRSRDARQQAELEVRTSIEALRSTDEQARVRMEALQLSEKELAQAQRRFENGVATNLEVTDAQTRLARAREDNDTAVYALRAARIDLAAALGDINQISR